MEKLQITDIKFGKIDAHNELEEVGEDFYIDSFLEYDKYKINSFINGENYFICGNKGTGKTALLKYLECTLSKDAQNLVIPVRFKSQIDSMDKKNMRNMANNIKEDFVVDVSLEKEKSYVLIWQIYLINQIIKSTAQGEYHLFENTNDYNMLLKLLQVLYSDEKGRIVPKLVKGYVKVNASSLKKIDASVETEIEFNKENEKINFNKTAKLILDLFAKLNYLENPVYILVDELELSVKNKKEFERDIELVRDLILAVDKINHLSKEKGYDIRVIASVRNEVINNVLAYGYEINKCVEDYGVTVDWFQKGGSYLESPLLKLIENKIHASEREKGCLLTEDVWSTYFAPQINETEVRKYILSYSWQRPRDVIRMMRLVQDEWKDEEFFSQEMFDKAMQRYSEKTWNEIAEELVLSYPDEKDIQAIKKFFTGIKVPFTFQYLNRRAEELGAIYDYVDSFFKKNRMIDFLEKMFEWGVIGNSGSRMVFKFLGDRDLSPTNDMILHRPLRNFFAVQSR
ncbi:MAG: hypothetical protein NC305_17435 [Lachnospiraceae bacterium]|nr:hypothetical protein [Butyrivibrio sp.]MCM1344701.1 hypothetical protein [Muribaculaceae bacterium]MCM1412305.1 hypothetical protein [Lachnospiraceae bacterium]